MPGYNTPSTLPSDLADLARRVRVLERRTVTGLGRTESFDAPIAEAVSNTTGSWLAIRDSVSNDPAQITVHGKRFVALLTATVGPLGFTVSDPGDPIVSCAAVEAQLAIWVDGAEFNAGAVGIAQHGATTPGYSNASASVMLHAAFDEWADHTFSARTIFGSSGAGGSLVYPSLGGLTLVVIPLA